MKFSVIVPVYKVEPYIDRCIACLREQTYSDIEIILVDDGSPDNCPAICDRYAAMDPRIKVIHKENEGLSAARNQGFRAATGEYVMYVDPDDYIDTDACQRFLPYAQQGLDVIVGDARMEGGYCPLEHIAPSERVYGGQEYLKLAVTARKAPMVVWLNIYRRQFLLDHDLWFQRGILHEDEQYMPRVFLEAQTVINTGIVFYHYILREGSITTQKDKRRNARDLYATCCQLEKIYQNLEDKVLADLLLDTLVVKYLNMTQIGKLYRYQDEFLHKDFIKRNASRRKTVMKARLYCFSPVLYYHINYFSKKLLRSRA